MLETRWLAEWEAQAKEWAQRAEQALARGHLRTAYVCRSYASACGLARFLINTSDMELKRSVYLDYAEAHREAMSLLSTPVRQLSVLCASSFELAAQLHLPAGQGPHPCVVVFAGLGSCKEEMVTLARALVDRGVAALVPDMPGCGATLFTHGVPCSMARVEQAIEGLARAVVEHPDLDESATGATGLCMGGGYAFRAVCIDSRYRYAATLFPLFISMVAHGSVPQWMRSGPWTALQTGGLEAEQFIAQMGPQPTDAPRVPFFMVHGRHDNWMTWDAANALLQRVQHPDRELLTLENPPIVTGGNATTHAMPVGEAMHWVVPLVADWLSDRAHALTRGSRVARAASI
jgi:dienelactone hydrolase